MAESYQKCEGLLKQCQNNITHQRPYLLRPGLSSIKFKSNLNENKYGMVMSPQQMGQNAKVIQKMRKNYHKKSKQASIKKTNLGQDLLTFSPEEYARLQLIDECQELGIRYRQKIDDYGQENVQKQTAVDRLKRLAKVDEMVDEVKRNLAWGSLFQKENNPAKKNVLTKKIGFQKRYFPRHRLSNDNLRLEESSIDIKLSTGIGQKSYQTSTNKRGFWRKNIFQSKIQTMGKTHESGGISFSQKLQIIKDEAERSTSRLCRVSGPFMTKERKQAIYGCQVLRYAKKILQPYQLQNLQLSVQGKPGQNFKQDGEGQQRGECQQQSCQAEQILAKNMNRIKAQRKRVIEKMIC